MTQSTAQTSLRPDAVDLSNCDREPIHIPGTVQSHGALLVCAGPQQTIVHVSANAKQVLGLEPADILRQPLDVLIGDSAAATLLTSLETAQTAKRAQVFHLEATTGKQYHAQIIDQAGRLIIELEPVSEDAEKVPPLLLVTAMMARMQQLGDVENLCALSVDRVRALIRFDRVMIYKFLHDGSGRVVAESKRRDLQPFLDLHYPASDIPQQARALYLKSWIRLIADVGSAPVPIVPERDASGEPVDLSLASLRSVSPIHIEYLTNMGVAASMSISIIVGGKLWGLIACHNYTPRLVSADTRCAAELFGQIFSLQIESLEPADRANLVRTARTQIDELLASFPTSGKLIDNWRPRLGDLRGLIPCDGAGLWIDGIWSGQGATPPPREIPALARLLHQTPNAAFATHELSNRLAAAAGYASDASGLLAIPLSRTTQDYLMFFRREIVRNVKWGGDPNKPVTVGPRGDRLTPRKSFEVWEAQVLGQSKPWEQSDRLTAEALRISLLEVVLRLNEVAATERAIAAERQRLLVAELNHRVKNVLALIKALVSQGQTGKQSLASFVQGLEGRINSMAFAHDQAMQDNVGSLQSLFEVETAPYRQSDEASVRIAGPATFLNAQAFSVMAMVAHELVTNAAKYGALSVPHGRININWLINPSGDCVIDWEETGGPAVQAPERTGFGTTLIERQIAHELNGSSQLHYELSGLRARFVMPMMYVVDTDSGDIQPRPIGLEAAVASQALHGLDILLVEDNFLIALDADTMLYDSGAASVTVASDAKEALQVIAQKPVNVAVLDINLGRGTSMPVAEELLKRCIPFIFASGYKDVSTIPEHYRGIPIVTKPYTAAGLAGAITEVFGKKS